MKFQIISLFFLILTVSAGTASASCAPTEFGVPACAYFTRADAVFLGRAVKVEDAPKDEELPAGSRKVRFQVLQNFKGADNPTFTLVAKDAKSGGGLAVKSGQTWVIYASNDIVVKSFSAFRGFKIEPKTTSEELETLKTVAAGKSETAIAGRLSSDAQSGIYALEAAEITVEGAGRRLTARTDRDGAFNLAVPAAGKYKVELKFPFHAGLVWTDSLLGTNYAPGATTVFKYEIELYQGDCSFSFFEVSKK